MTAATGTPVYPLAIAADFSELPYLPLGMITANLRYWRDGSLRRYFNIQPIRLAGPAEHPLEQLHRELARAQDPICLFSSYVWNHTMNLDFARELRARNPGAYIIFGGPEVPKYDGETEKFLQENPFVDVAVLGEGEISCAELLQHLAGHGTAGPGCLEGVAGLVYREGDSIRRQAPRDRLEDVNTLPSPYLTGEFGDWFEGMDYTVIETNRGCPFGCTYCDWGSATLQKVTRFAVERLREEMEFIASRRANKLFIADANFGMLEQDIEIAQLLVDIRARTGYPRRLYTNFAKNGGRRLMQVIKILHEGGLLPTGIIALQTNDPDTLRAIKRDNVKTATYEKMMEYFNAEGIPMASDIMIGLPGQTIDSLQRDLQFCFDWKVSANGNYTSMMPNAPMAEKSYREQYQIEVDSEGLIASTSSFSRDDLRYMKALFTTYLFHVRLGVMRYYLYFLQLEHGVPALDLLRRWLDAVLGDDPALPLSRRVYHDIFALDSRKGDWALLSWDDEADFLFGDFGAYCDEFFGFSWREYDITLEPDIASTLRATQCAVMPQLDQAYTLVANVDHDFNGYFKQAKHAPSLQHLEGKLRPLKLYPASILKVMPLTTRHNFKFMMMDGHTDGWEYRTFLRMS